MNSTISWTSSFAISSLISVAAINGCDWASPESSKTKHLEAGQAYYSKEKYPEALIEFKNAAKLDPNNADVHYRLALTHLRLGGRGNLQGAFTEFSRTTELDKTNQDAQLKLGELYLLGNEPAKARAQADSVLISAPQNTEGLILRGRSLISEMRYQEGIEEFRKASELDPKNMTLYIDLARAYFAAKNPSAAEETLKRALTIAPRSAEIMLALGDLHMSTGKPERAEAIYKDTLEIAPQNEGVYVRLAGFYQRHNRLAEAQTTLQNLAAIKPQDENPHIYLGDFFTGIGRQDQALASYQRATELNTGSVIARDKLLSHYLDAGKTAEAERMIQDILGKNKSDLIGRFFNARLSLLKGNADEAIPLFQSVVKDEPQLASGHHFLGVAFMKKHQVAQARAALTEAVKLSPGTPESRTALAELLLAQGETDMALEHAGAALQLNPRNVQAALITGDAYLRKGDYSKSKQVYQAIAKALPNESIGPYRLGLVAHAEKNDAKALAYFEDALAKKPAAIEPVAQIAMVLMAQGKSSEARERIMRQLEISPTSAPLYNMLGQLWMTQKDLEKAEMAFKKTIDLDNALLLAYMNLGQVYFQSGKTDLAVKEYETVLVKDPQSIQAHMMLGIIHASQKEYDKAKARYEDILKLNSRFAPAANNLAWILVEQGGNIDVALSYAQTAREQKPDDPYVADTLGWIYYKKNAYLLAISLLKEARDKLSTEAVVHFHYGMARHKNGDIAEAKKALQDSLKLNSAFAGAEEARRLLAEL